MVSPICRLILVAAGLRFHPMGNELGAIPLMREMLRDIIRRKL
jgi:hypothetical protein